MQIACPLCRSVITFDDVNVGHDIAKCRRCSKTFSFSELNHAAAYATADLTTPPRGAWFEQLPDGFRVGATTRTWMALIFIPLICYLYGSPPAHRAVDPASSLFELILLIGIAFFIVTYCAMSVAGKVEVTLRGERLLIFTGVGPLGWLRNYSWSDFSLVREELSGWGKSQRTVIVLEGRRGAAFGAMLSKKRRNFVLSALRQKLSNTSHAQTGVAALTTSR